MRLIDCMTRDVETIDEQTPADQAFSRMKVRGIRHLVVLSGGRVSGVLSERDLGGRRAESLSRGKTVGELMSRHAVTIDLDATVREAARVLAGKSIGCLPVTDGDKLVGIVTTADLLNLLGRGAEKALATTHRRLLRVRGPRRRQGVRQGP
jgi:acetoin utilization protein AcuB